MARRFGVEPESPEIQKHLPDPQEAKNEFNIEDKGAASKETKGCFGFCGEGGDPPFNKML